MVVGVGGLDNEAVGTVGMRVTLLVTAPPPSRHENRETRSLLRSEPSAGGDQQQAHVNVIIPTLSVCSGKEKGLVNGVYANILVDTGAAVTVLSKGMWDRSKGPGAHLQTTAERNSWGSKAPPCSYMVYGTSTA